MELIAVKGRWIVSGWGIGSRLHEDSAVLVENGLVQGIAPSRSLEERYPTAQIVGDGTHLVMPGLINAHSHGHGISTLRLGVPDDPLELRVLEMRASPKVDPYWDTLLSCARQLECGITSTVHLDSYYAGDVCFARSRGNCATSNRQHEPIPRSTPINARRAEGSRYRLLRM